MDWAVPRLFWNGPARWPIPSPRAKVVETSRYFLSLLLTIKKNKERIQSLVFLQKIFSFINFLLFYCLNYFFLFVCLMMRWVAGGWCVEAGAKLQGYVWLGSGGMEGGKDRPRKGWDQISDWLTLNEASAGPFFSLHTLLYNNGY